MCSDVCIRIPSYMLYGSLWRRTYLFYEHEMSSHIFYYSKHYKAKSNVIAYECHVFMTMFYDACMQQSIRHSKKVRNI